MKRPFEFLTAGLILGELSVYVGCSNLAAGLALAAVFVCILFFLWRFLQPRFLQLLCGGARQRVLSYPPGMPQCGRKLRLCLWNARNLCFRFLRVHFALPAQRAAVRAAVLLLSAGFLLGALRLYAASVPSAGACALDRRIVSSGEGGKVTLELTVKALERNRAKGKQVAYCGNVLVTIPDSAPGSADFRIGNRIRVRGKLSRPQSARNPGQFDYGAYLRAGGISHTLYADSVTVTDRRVLPFRNFLYRLRCRCADFFRGTLEEDDAAFLCAALFGDRSGLSGEFYDMYRRNGIAHLLAISGLHTVLIGMGLYRILRRAGAGLGLSGAAAGVFLVCYSIFTGNGTGVVRAVLMMLLSFLASNLGRTYDLRSAAAAAAAAVLLAKPYDLFQCGFQLSFLAVLSIGGPGKAVEKRLERWCRTPHTKEEKRIRKRAAAFLSPLIASTSVTLFSLPVTAYWFFSVPPWSILLNLIVIPLMGYVLAAGIAILFTAAGGALFLRTAAPDAAAGIPWLGEPAAGTGIGAAPGAAGTDLVLTSASRAARLLSFLIQTEGGIAHRILEGYTFLCRAAEKLPFHRILLGRPAFWQIALYYVLLAAAWFLFLRILDQRRDREIRGVRRDWEIHGARGAWEIRRAHAAWGALLLLSVLAFFSIRPVRSRHIILWFLDVGQGDAIVIERGHSFVLIDGGSSSEKKCGQYILQPFLESRAAERLDAIFLTHPDQDHTNGAEYLLTEVPDLEIKCVVLNQAAEEDDVHYGALKEAAALHRNRDGPPEVRFLGAGERMGLFTCLSPRKGRKYADRNEESLVLLLESGGKSCLLMGDADSDNEKEILSLADAEAEKASEVSLMEGAADAGTLSLRERLTGVDVLKAGHHGSATSTAEEFLELVAPETAVLSYGKNNRYGHPHAETVERLQNAGVRIRRTAEEGAVRIDWK